MPRRGEKYWVHSQDVVPQEDPPRRRPSGPPCPSRCNSRWRREVKEPLDAYDRAVQAWQDDPMGLPPGEPEVPGITPWLGDPVFCPKCAAEIRRRISDIKDLAAEAQAENSGQRKRPPTDRVSGSRDHASPSAIGDLLDQLGYELRSWQSVALGQDETPPLIGELLPEIAILCNRLSEIYYTRLITSPDYGEDFGLEMQRWHIRLKTLTTAGKGRHILPLPCHRCGNRSLEVEDGATYVECAHREDDGARCGLLLSRAEYAAELEQWLARHPKKPAARPAA